MAIEQSNSRPDLLLAVDRDAPTPLRAQLERQLREAVRSGRLGAGERLPSSRALAGYLGLSRSLVQDCYEQLTAEGYLISRGGSATRAAKLSTREPDAPGRQARPTDPPLIADFRSGVPDLGLTPRADWAWAVREACRTAPNSDFDYGDPRGHERLRQVLAGYVRRVRATDASAERIVVCAGYQQALTLVLRTLAVDGRSLVAVEDPGSVDSVADAAAGANGRCVPVPVDEHGIDVSALDSSGARVVVVTPAHQWPTGVVLSPARRHQLIGWAHERDAIVVEDDYDAEFRYDRDPVGSLQGLAADRVVSVGTVSKSLAPALRLGWAVLPRFLAGPVAAAKHINDRGTATLDQLALAALIESGRFDRHLRHMRAEYSQRRDTLVAALARHAPHIRLSGLAAGFHAVAHLSTGADEEDVVASALARRVGLYGMSSSRSTRATTPPRLVMGFGNTGVRAIEEGIAAVAPCLR